MDELKVGGVKHRINKPVKGFKGFVLWLRVNTGLQLTPVGHLTSSKTNQLVHLRLSMLCICQPPLPQRKKGIISSGDLRAERPNAALTCINQTARGDGKLWRSSGGCVWGSSHSAACFIWNMESIWNDKCNTGGSHAELLRIKSICVRRHRGHACAFDKAITANKTVKVSRDPPKCIFHLRLVNMYKAVA